MKHALGELGAEQRLQRLAVDVAKKLQGVRVGLGVAAQDGARLEHELVGAE